MFSAFVVCVSFFFLKFFFFHIFSIGLSVLTYARLAIFVSCHTISSLLCLSDCLSSPWTYSSALVILTWHHNISFFFPIRLPTAPNIQEKLVWHKFAYSGPKCQSCKASHLGSLTHRSLKDTGAKWLWSRQFFFSLPHRNTEAHSNWPKSFWPL